MRSAHRRAAAPRAPALQLPLLAALLAALAAAPAAAAQQHPNPLVSWTRHAVFRHDPDLSDEFDGSTLNETRWDVHALRNPDTGCPKWNGPPSRSAPKYATYFPPTQDPVTGRNIHRFYRLRRGKLTLYIQEKPLSFFTDREYYCNSTTFRCNHDPSIRCYSTDFQGNPVYADSAKTTFRGVIHDKCKKAPFCIAHPEYVANAPRVYNRYVANHIASKKTFKYGFVEARVRLPPTPALTAVWMHNDEMVDGYCRWRKNPDPSKPWNIYECPSLIRSRRWQEIDLLEAMNTAEHKLKYIPNIHLFASYKGEFTSSTAVDNGDGTMGGGPIVVKQSVFSERRPSFTDLPDSVKVPNDYHFNQGSVHTLNREWGKRRRTIGMYWSPNEIRFYVDGVEVKRVKNTLIHQPMHLDLSNGWNVGWGKEEPSSWQTKRSRSNILYIRRWQVYTEGGVEPPSNLALDTTMDTKFKDLYGDKLLGVLGRFPVNDDATVFQSIPEPPDVIVPTSEPVSGAEAGSSRMVWEQQQGMGNIFNDSSTRDFLRSRRDGARSVRQGAAEGKEFLPAGGDGNLRYSEARGKMNQRQKNIALSQPDRLAVIPRPGATPIPLKDGATTCFEFSNPNKDAAGWSTKRGLGTEASLA